MKLKKKESNFDDLGDHFMLQVNIMLKIILINQKQIGKMSFFKDLTIRKDTAVRILL